MQTIPYGQGPRGANKLWGTSSRDLYAVGNNGLIAHYNGSSWRRIESGTGVKLLDIYGSTDGCEVWICGWMDPTGDCVILRKVNTGFQTIWDSGQNSSDIYNGELLGGLWTDGKSDYWITGSGDVFLQSLRHINKIRRESVSLGNYVYRIRGTATNDVLLVGNAAMVWHWNGKTWYKYNDLYDTNDRLYSVGVSLSIVIAVGRTYSTFPTTSLVILGRR